MLTNLTSVSELQRAYPTSQLHQNLCDISSLPNQNLSSIITRSFDENYPNLFEADQIELLDNEIDHLLSITSAEALPTRPDSLISIDNYSNISELIRGESINQTTVAPKKPQANQASDKIQRRFSKRQIKMKLVKYKVELHKILKNPIKTRTRNNPYLPFFRKNSKTTQEVFF